MRYILSIAFVVLLFTPAHAEMCLSINPAGDVIIMSDPGTSEQISSTMNGLQKKPDRYTVLCGEQAKEAYAAWDEKNRANARKE